ncbi:MAG: tetratricopeptide repeat protein, partial [Planctomycetes bacterium]|nr:tetratricopeptide repeat protein [Planctomycetota bacterium]
MRGPAPILRILIVLALGMLTGIAPPPDDRAEFVRLMNIGKAQIENRAATKAIETLTAALAIDPASPAARRNLGRAYLLTGRPADAQRAIDVLTDHADASSRYLAGIASLRLSRFDVAATALEQAARLDPRTPTVRFQLGGALQASGRHDEAITQLQETIRLDPFHASAHYKLSGYARRAGRTAEANRHLREFTRLRRLLGETMRTARALETCVHTQPEAAPPPDPEPDGAGPLEIRFVDVTATVLAEDAGASIAAAAVIDVDDRGRSRIFAVDGDGGLALLTLAEEGRFVREPMGSVPPPAGEVYCRAGDFHDVVPAGERYDPAKHARNDMVVAADDAVHLLRRRDDAAFEPVTEQAGLAGARGGPVRWVDWDHDGDLDLAVGGAAGLRAWQNNGDGTFADVTTETGLAGAGPVMDFAAADLDENTAIDLVLARGDEPSLVFENRRAGRFARAPEPPGPWPAARQVLLDDVDDDGTVDAVLVHPDGALVIPAGRSGRTRVPSPGLRVTAATLVDVDNDGRLDLVLAGRAPDGAGGLRLQRNGGRGGWSDASGAAGLADLTLPVPRSLIPADFDGDGDSDLLVVTATKGLCVLRNDGGHANGQLKVRLRTLKTNPSGLGARVEVRTGLHRVTRTVSRIPIEIGLDGRSRLDSIQTVWTNGVVDNTIDVEAPAGPLVVEEKNVAAGSCPFLYAWDGTTYRFVTDILGNAPLGLSLRRDVILPADPDEIVHVGDAAALPPVAGRFRLAITDEYRE